MSHSRDITAHRTFFFLHIQSTLTFFLAAGGGTLILSITCSWRDSTSWLHPSFSLYPHAHRLRLLASAYVTWYNTWRIPFRCSRLSMPPRPSHSMAFRNSVQCRPPLLSIPLVPLPTVATLLRAGRPSNVAFLHLQCVARDCQWLQNEMMRSK